MKTLLGNRTAILIFAAGFFLATVLYPHTAAAAQVAWMVVFNGSDSTTQVLDTADGPVVPVYFPVSKDGGSHTYGVRVESDPVAMVIKVTKVKRERQVRDSGDCPRCIGSKDCQSCYPPGSKVNTAGGECYQCNGTGSCPYCRGSGDCYSCDGDGFPGNGCNTCGKVLATKSDW